VLLVPWSSNAAPPVSPGRNADQRFDRRRGASFGARKLWWRLLAYK
jgi:hypothetical protein